MRRHIPAALFALALLAGAPSLAGAADERSATANPGTAPWISVLNNQDALGVLGKEVRSSADESMGRIVDVLVDRSGQVRGAVIDFGGFLGVGSRKIVVDWAALHFPANKSELITADLTRDQVRTAPEYKDGKPVVVLGALPPNIPGLPEM
jgi:hypothetical protein